MGTAACANFGFQRNMLFYKRLRQKFSQVRRMAIPCPTFFTPTLRQYDRYSGQVRGWRFGRILRVHAQTPLKFFDPLFQRCIFSLQFSNTLLIELFFFGNWIFQFDFPP
jgi:hypothetical protein